MCLIAFLLNLNRTRISLPTCSSDSAAKKMPTSTCVAKDMSCSARNYRTARHRGEIDLIGWDKDVLCFIEVKTRTTRDVKPAEAAVGRNKRHDLRIVIGDYLRTLPRRQFPEPPPWRFDVITVYYEREPRNSGAPPMFSIQNRERQGRSNLCKTFVCAIRLLSCFRMRHSHRKM